jgi:hypothetical protein
LEACGQSLQEVLLIGDRATAYEDEQGHVALRWGLDRESLSAAMRKDGRYLRLSIEFLNQGVSLRP